MGEANIVEEIADCISCIERVLIIYYVIFSQYQPPILTVSDVITRHITKGVVYTYMQFNCLSK